MKYCARLFLLLTVFALLVACSPAADETPPAQEAASESNTDTATESATGPTSVPTLEPTAEPTATPEPPPSPTAEPAAETEPEPAEIPPGFINYSADNFDIQLAYPVTWWIGEDPERGVTVESSPDVLDDFPDIDGAGLIIFPRDELAAEDVVEALRQSVFSLGPPPETMFIERPTVTMVGDHEVATAPYDERGSGQVGFYVFVKNGGRGVFIFSVANGANKFALMEDLATIIGSVNLSEVPAS